MQSDRLLISSVQLESHSKSVSGVCVLSVNVSSLFAGVSTATLSQLAFTKAGAISSRCSVFFLSLDIRSSKLAFYCVYLGDSTDALLSASFSLCVFHCELPLTLLGGQFASQTVPLLLLHLQEASN